MFMAVLRTLSLVQLLKMALLMCFQPTPRCYAMENGCTTSMTTCGQLHSIIVRYLKKATILFGFITPIISRSIFPLP